MSECKWNPKKYFFKGRTFTWGKILTQEQIKALKKGEMFTLLGKDGEPYSEVFMDSYNQIREQRIEKERSDQKGTKR